MRLSISTLSLISILILSGCLFDEGCELIRSIDFSSNSFQAKFITSHDSLTINDTFRIKVDLPEDMEDADGMTYRILNSPEVWVRFTDQDKVEPLDTINVFNVGGETMHAVFDEYFEMNFIKGRPGVNDLIFLHQTELSNGRYTLEIEYVVKKKGVFNVEVWYHDNINIEGGLNTDCLNIKEPKIYWSDNPANNVFEYYSKDYDQSDKFVFEVN